VQTVTAWPINQIPLVESDRGLACPSIGIPAMSTVTASFLSKLEQRRADEYRATEQLLQKAQREGRDKLTDAEEIDFRAHKATLKALDSHIDDTKSELKRMGSHSITGGGQDAMSYGRQWSERAAEKLMRSMGGGMEQRAVVSGSIDIPALVEPEIVEITRPTRLIDLLVNRRVATGQAVEYFRQTVRTNNADVVPDSQVKPTSVFTVEGVTDHMRVLAHLSEPTPNRLWADHSNLQSWLTSEMFGGLADALESQVIAGDGQGENFDGILVVPGTTQVPFDTDAVTTLRSAVTALQVIGETPNAWVVNPADAAEIDLARWATQGGFLSEGYEGGGGAPSSNNIFGSGVSQRVVSNSIPAGTAVLADWSKLALYIREDSNLAIDASGVLFTKNEFIARCEMRAVSALLRPSAFAVVDLVP
jgi:HK97 family phage major capsid protein